MLLLFHKQINRILRRMELRIRNDDMLRNYAITERLKLYSDIKRILLKKGKGALYKGVISLYDVRKRMHKEIRKMLKESLAFGKK